MAEEKEKTFAELLDMLELQEDVLQFRHFTNSDAWELGSFMVQEARKNGLKIAISIRLNSGVTVFQHFMDGARLNNEHWMQRKFNVVNEMETSSLYLYTKLKKTNRTMADIFLEEKNYANAGGGFPIRIEDVGVIGAILVSGMNHVADHDFIIKCLAKYLHTDEVPRIKEM